MTNKNIIFTIILLFIFNACQQTPALVENGGYYYNNIYFAKDIEETKQLGIKEGCKTAKGDYTKSHILFNNNIEYQKGWFIGRNRCNKN